MLDVAKIFLLTAFAVLHLVSIKHNTVGTKAQIPAVKAASIHKVITITITPEITPAGKPVSQSTSTTTSLSTQKKVYGAWYWQPNLGRAQMWVGTDAQGKDIFVDQIPTPTLGQPSQPASDNDKQACLEKVEQEFANQQPKGCQTWTDQYDNQRTTCNEIYMPQFYTALGQQCGIHIRGG